MHEDTHTHLPRDPFAYIGFWQMMTFVMLLLLIWVNELRDLAGFFFGEAPSEAVVVRGCVLSAAVLLTAIISVGNTYLQQKRVLRALISVCAKCHKVRVHADNWQTMEDYFSANSLLSFSHGLCPGCMAETMHDIQALEERKHAGTPVNPDARDRGHE